MRQIRYVNIRQRSRNPFVQFLGFLVGSLVIALALVLGFFLVAGFFGFILIAGLGVYLRLWWLKRKAVGGLKGDSVLEAEYHVVDKKTDEIREDYRR